MDSHIIKFGGTAESPETLNDSKNYVIAGEWQIDSVVRTPNQDGSYVYTYKLKPVRLLEQKEGGDRVRIKVKSSHSTRLRGAIWHLNPDEDYYERVMNALIPNIEGVIKYLNIE